MKIELDEAIEKLGIGGVVAIPTETVYGLAASVVIPAAIEEIFTLKKRPADNPLIVHVASLKQAKSLIASLPPGTEELAEAFWPGSLTLVLPADLDQVPEVARAQLKTVGLRVPNHPMTLELLEEVGPVVAPSANVSGRPSSTCRSHVEADFGDNFPVLDGGPCQQGVESTILYWSETCWQIGRLGALLAEEIGAILGYKPVYDSPKDFTCPGQKHRHYAPRAKLVLGTGSYDGDPKVVLGFSERTYQGAESVISLGSLSDPNEVANRLYAALRSLDDRGVEAAWVDFQFPKRGILLTIAERLERASKS